MPMNDTLRVGDLACVVRTCCAGSFGETGGIVGAVAWIASKTTTCTYCRERNVGLHAASAAGRPGVPLTWLKRIDPHREPGGPSRRDELVLEA
jgi:hypothetical protein